jgi:putative oxidoreductase
MQAEHAVDAALLILRLDLGLILLAHGVQKLFGWFGGGGLGATAEVFDQLGFRPGKVSAILAGLGEAGGGLLIALGLLTPLGGAAVAATMLVAGSVHASAGFFEMNGGFEYPMALGIFAIGVTIAGPGSLSLDAAMDYPMAEPWMVLTALVASCAAALLLVARRNALLKRQPQVDLRS